ncbi:hypothetical protein [Tenacibaculum xiamenense]|uniref:hypothetical protein n=1 Tax=Tenacibaculum xiamenense TaxID=1261553 RepID=UPI003893E691
MLIESNAYQITKKHFEYVIKKPPCDIVPTKIVSIQYSGHIYFPNNFNQPLPTMVEAYRTKKFHGINIKTLVFIPKQHPINELKEEEKFEYINVSSIFSINSKGKPKVQSFIHNTEDLYTKFPIEKYPEKYQSYGEFNAYTIRFIVKENDISLPQGIGFEEISKAQVFLWDIDPETSRGTETTVKTTKD